MTILVIGRHGQLARSLAERGAERVVRCGRPDLDLGVGGSARAAIVDAAPTLVINAAAYTAVDRAESDVELAQRINAEAAGEVAAASAELGIPVIHISTDYVFDGTATAPIDETAPTGPVNVYGRSKLAGEELLREANPEHLILRTSWLVSPFGRNFVRTMVDQGGARDELRVVSDQIGSPTSALDLADSILAAASQLESGDRTGLGETYHLAGTGSASWYDVAVAVQTELARLNRQHAIVAPIATADWPTPAARPAYSALDCTKFARTFGHRLPDWRDSIGPIVDRIVNDGGAPGIRSDG